MRPLKIANLFQLDRDIYRELTEEFLIRFAKKGFTKKTKKILGIKEPKIGKDHGKTFIKAKNYSAFISLYLMYPFASRDEITLSLEEVKS